MKTRREAIEALEYLISGECCDSHMDYVNEIQMAITDMKICDANNTGWISVKDRLPEDGQEVLGFLYHGGCEVLTFLAAKNRWQGTDAWYWFEEISHWMPLPEPPKEET